MAIYISAPCAKEIGSEWVIELRCFMLFIDMGCL